MVLTASLATPSRAFSSVGRAPRSHRGGRGIETPIAHSRHLAAITGRGVRALLHLLGECQRVEAVECLPKGAHLAGANVDHLDECRKLGKLATKLSP